MFLDLRRGILGAATLLGVVLLTRGLIRADVIPVGPKSLAGIVFGSGAVAGLFTLITVVLSIDQVVLSRVFGSSSGLRDELQGTREVRENVADITGRAAVPNDPGQSLAVVGDGLMAHADRLGDDHDTDVQTEMDEYALAVAEYGERVSGVRESDRATNVLTDVLGRAARPRPPYLDYHVVHGLGRPVRPARAVKGNGFTPGPNVCTYGRVRRRTALPRGGRVTQWIENPTGGRDRGPRAIARAWVEVLTRPKRFFQSAVAPGDQAPGLVFAMSVVLVEEFVRYLLVGDAYPVVAGQQTLSAVLWLGVAVVLAAPAALHLTAALETVLLMPFVSERAGISQTVQTIAYSAAPCAFAGVPIPEVRALCGFYAATLLVVGVATVHDTSVERAALASLVPAALVFGVGFRTFDAVETLLRQWYII